MFESRVARTSRNFLLALLPLAFLVPAAWAGTINVNVATNEDIANGNCSLREAMQSHANGAPYNGCTGTTATNNKIQFTANFSISVPQELANITAARGTLELTGTGRTITITCVNSRIFDVESGASFNVNNLALMGCTTSGAGIAINSNSGDLSLTNVTIRNFISNTSAGGAAIRHTGASLSMVNVTMSGNRVDDLNVGTFAGSGGALHISNVSLPDTVNIVNCFFDSNRAEESGGAVYISNSPALGHSITFTNTIWQGNQAFGNTTEDGGGGLYIVSDNDPTDIILITGGFFRSNSAVNGAGGGMLLTLGSRMSYVDPNVPSAGGIFATHFFNNTAGGPAGPDGSGGGIFSRGELTVVQSSFQANISTNGSGGAVAIGNNAGNSMFANVTFNANRAAQNGGGLARMFDVGQVTLINDTFSGNAAGGAGGTQGAGALFNASGSNGILAQNSIFASSVNIAPVTNMNGNCVGFIAHDGHSLQFAPNTGCGSPAIVAGDPKLGPLTPSPGPNVNVWTMNPLNYSWALATGDNATCNAGPILTFDATGVPGIRPLNGANCDMGASESSAIPDLIFRDGIQGNGL